METKYSYVGSVKFFWRVRVYVVNAMAAPYGGMDCMDCDLVHLLPSSHTFPDARGV